jgi:hypothetical protein
VRVLSIKHHSLNFVIPYITTNPTKIPEAQPLVQGRRIKPRADKDARLADRDARIAELEALLKKNRQI